MNGEGNGELSARQRFATQAQVVQFVVWVVAVSSFVGPFAIWAYKLQQGQAAQQVVIDQMVQFMETQTRLRRAAGARERQRRELCLQGALPTDRCLNLTSEADLDAMEK